MTNAELLALLREARESVEQDFDWGEHDAAGRQTLLSLLRRIDAALAAREAEEQVEVRWMQNGFVEEEQIADVHGGTIVIRARAPDDWAWRLIRQGRCSTENEAIAAARGMR